MQKAVVFGCGETAVTSRKMIHERFDVAAYTDNNPALWGTEFDGVAVIPPVQIPEDAGIVVASESYYSEIINGLLQNRAGTQQIFAVVNHELLQYRAENRKTEQQEFTFPSYEPLLTTLEVGLSGLCNSKCRYCRYHSEYNTAYAFPRTLMGEEILDRLCGQIASIHSFTNLNLVGCGETFTHPHWPEYVTRILKARPSFERCTLYTNGMLLTKENAERLKGLSIPNLQLVLSIDGTSPEDCEYWRKGEKFSTIRENIHRAYDILGQNACFTINNCTVLPRDIDFDNPAEVETYRKHCADWCRKEFPFTHCSSQIASPLAEGPGTHAVAPAIYPVLASCSSVFRIIAVWSNGDVIACPCGAALGQLKDFCVGNIEKDQLEQLFYENRTYRRLRTDLLNSKKPDLCCSCAFLGGSSLRCLQKT